MNVAKSVVRYICGYVLATGPGQDQINLFDMGRRMDDAFGFDNWTNWIETYFDFVPDEPDWSDVFMTRRSGVEYFRT